MSKASQNPHPDHSEFPADSRKELMRWYREFLRDPALIDAPYLADQMEDYLAIWTGGTNYHALRKELEGAYIAMRLRYPRRGEHD